MLNLARRDVRGEKLTFWEELLALASGATHGRQGRRTVEMPFLGG